MQKETEDTEACSLDLLARLISAAVMIAICCTAFYFGGYVMFGLASVIGILMMLDVSNALSKGGHGISRITLIACSVCVAPLLYFFKSAGYVIVCAFGISVMAIITIFNKKHDFSSLIAGCFTLIYPLLPASILILLTVCDITTNSRLGSVLIFGAALCACLADAFAYFGGKLFGHQKLCPDISPKKTVAGSIASFVGGTVGGVIMALFFNKNIQMMTYLWIVIGLLCGGFSQIGDLLASMLKRYCGVKDYGSYIPGHGGIMDRMDSVSICLFAIVTITQIFFTKVI